MSLRLFGDRISHPFRACLLFLQTNKVPFEEKTVNLLKGEHLDNKDLPFGKVPVLKVGDSLTLTQSSTILRYLASKVSEDSSSWYPRDAEKRAKIDEFFDFFQSQMNKELVAAIQHKLFYKTLLKQHDPDIQAIQHHWKHFTKAQSQFTSYFLEKKPFLGGETLNIADLLASSTFEQAKLVDKVGISTHVEISAYLNRCENATGQHYLDNLANLRQVPYLLKQAGML